MRTFNLRWAPAESDPTANLKSLGNVSPQAPLSVDPPMAPRDEAIFLLHVAAEVEHALLVQYLYAALSLRQEGTFIGDHLPDKPGDLTKKWFMAILEIAEEEMGHLLTVQNLLRFVGGPLTLEREDFPFRSDVYPFHFRLEPLTKHSLAKYIAAERPDKPEGLSQHEQEVLRDLLEPFMKPHHERVNRVGILYARVLAVVSQLTAEDLRPDLVNLQGTPDEWNSLDPQTLVHRDSSGKIITVDKNPLVFQVKTLKDAIDALTAIATQGEGATMAPSSGDDSHFRRFFNIYLDPNFPDEKANPAWHPARPVAVNPNTTLRPDDQDGLDNEEKGEERESAKGRISNEQTRLWAQLFDLRYRILLTSISQCLRSDKNRDTLSTWAFDEMTNVAMMGNLLADLNRTDDPDDGTAGAPFELPYTLDLAADPLDQWRLQRDLLLAAVPLYQNIKPASDSQKKTFKRLQDSDGADNGSGRRKFIADILHPPPKSSGGAGTGGDTSMKVSFAKDIKPLFRPIDIDHMKKRGVKLDDFAYMSDPTDNHQNALNVQARLTGNPPSMPPGGPYWTQQQLDLYAQWIADGYQP